LEGVRGFQHDRFLFGDGRSRGTVAIDLNLLPVFRGNTLKAAWHSTPAC
jgi:hypothetical protein